MKPIEYIQGDAAKMREVIATALAESDELHALCLAQLQSGDSAQFGYEFANELERQVEATAAYFYSNDAGYIAARDERDVEPYADEIAA